MSETNGQVYVFNDSPLFGGHEKIFLDLLPSLLESKKIKELSFFIAASNEKLYLELLSAGVHKNRIQRMLYEKKRGEPYFALLRIKYFQYISNIFKQSLPDLVLVLQGRIENTLVPVLAARRHNIPVISYLPMAHSTKEISRHFSFPLLPDLIRRRYYAMMSEFIVPSKAVMKQLRERGFLGKISIVPNVIRLGNTNRAREDIRNRLDIDQNAKIVLFIGRIDRHQKGLDLLLRAFQRDYNQSQGWILYFVGTGPDNRWLARKVKSLKLSTRIKIISWSDSPEEWISASNVVILPSRFEGVPLTMLEAVLYKQPILASNIDVYKEYLPSEALFDFHAAQDLFKYLEIVCEDRKYSIFDLTYKNVKNLNNIYNSQALFLKSIESYL